MPYTRNKVDKSSPEGTPTNLREETVFPQDPKSISFSTRDFPTSKLCKPTKK